MNQNNSIKENYNQILAQKNPSFAVKFLLRHKILYKKKCQ